MSARKDLTGTEFGDFKVIGAAFVYNTRVYWKTVCVNCSAPRTVASSNLINGTTSKCSCRKNGKKLLDYDEELHLCVDYQSGVKIKDLCEKYGVSVNTVFDTLDRIGIKRDRLPDSAKEEQETDMADIYRAEDGWRVQNDEKGVEAIFCDDEYDSIENALSAAIECRDRIAAFGKRKRSA